MKVLIIHDRGVLEEIVHVVSERGIQPDTAEDTSSARFLLQQNFYDLVIVDLTLPNTKGVGPAPSYSLAEDLIRDMLRGISLNSPGDIIGITQEKSALNNFGVAFDGKLMLVLEEDFEGKWKSQVSDKIEYLRRCCQSRELVRNNSYDVDVVIICALDIELDPYREKFDFFRDDSFKVGEANRFSFTCSMGKRRKGVAISLARAGQHATTSITQSVITYYRPKLCLMSGICGGVKDKVDIGDVIFFKSVTDWDTGKWSEDDLTKKVVFLQRPTPIDIYNSEALLLARSFKREYPAETHPLEAKAIDLSDGKLNNYSLNIRICNVASGVAVVAHENKTVELVKIDDNIEAVEMESYGLYFASKNTVVRNPEVMCIKAVVDFCDIHKNDGYQNACCFLSAEVTYEYMKRFPYEKVERT